MAYIKPIVVKSDGQKAEIAGSIGYPLLPTSSGHPSGAPDSGYFSIYMDSGDGKVYSKDSSSAVTQLSNEIGKYVIYGGVTGTVTSFTDGQTNYMGSVLSGLYSTSESIGHRLYIPVSGIINSVYIYGSFGTAGSNEAWVMYLRLNETTDTQIESVSVSSTTRNWSNTSLNVSVAAGDFVTIKSVQPTWGTNPASGRFHVVVVVDY